MNEKQLEADFYMDQFLNDFEGVSLGLGIDAHDSEKIIEAIKKIYKANNKELKPFK